MAMAVAQGRTRVRARTRDKGRRRGPARWTAFAAPGQLREAFARLMELRNVWGCYIGQKVQRGRAVGGPAVVCVVARKVARQKLTRKDLVPATIPFPVGRGRRVLLKTDVVQCPRRFRTQEGAFPQPVAGPGDRVVRASGESGTIGVVLKRRGSEDRVLTTAGHVFRDADPGESVIVVNGSGTAMGEAKLIARRISPRLDYALLRLVSPVRSANLYADQFPVDSAYDPDPGTDVGRTLWILRGNGSALRVTCRGIRGTFQLPSGGVLEEVILTDLVTTPGDSGCALVDQQRRVWGLLLGGLRTNGFRASVFGQATEVLIEEQAELA
jgi:trypsin-like peptidase